MGKSFMSDLLLSSQIHRTSYAVTHRRVFQWPRTLKLITLQVILDTQQKYSRAGSGHTRTHFRSSFFNSRSKPERKKFTCFREILCHFNVQKAQQYLSGHFLCIQYLGQLQQISVTTEKNNLLHLNSITLSSFLSHRCMDNLHLEV